MEDALLQYTGQNTVLHNTPDDEGFKLTGFC